MMIGGRIDMMNAPARAARVVRARLVMIEPAMPSVETSSALRVPGSVLRTCWVMRAHGMRTLPMLPDRQTM